MANVIITGTGSYIPERVVPNSAFREQHFYDLNREIIDRPGDEVIEKFMSITGISERRYLPEGMRTSDMATEASRRAIADADIDPESLDLIIVAHNFGDLTHSGAMGDTVPSLASRVKHMLKIRKPSCVAFDLLFGCPGWIQSVLTAESMMRTGKAKRALVIGAENLSRVTDPYDRDSMIYSDGAGATVLELQEGDSSRGILESASATFAHDEAYYLFFGCSSKPDEPKDRMYIKMYGRKIYEFALTHVPAAMKACLDSAGIPISEVKKIFIHQANEKMDHAIISRLYKLYKHPEPEDVAPMSIHKLGNSSVATIPTLLDLVRKGVKPEHAIHPGDAVLFASVGAGMNINAFVYRV